MSDRTVYGNKTIILINLLLLQGFVVGFSVMVMLGKTGQFIKASMAPLSIILAVIGGLSSIGSVLLVKEIVRLAQKETEADLNACRLQESQQLIDILRAHRHDFMNHIQVIYGLAKMGRIDNMSSYIKELAHNMNAESKLSRLSQPELAAFLIKKSTDAADQGISFELDIATDLSGLGVPSTEMVSIIGNIVDNAFHAVTQSDTVEKQVVVTMQESQDTFRLAVTNSGPAIPASMRGHIFDKGFTTKTEGSGLGLHITRRLVEKNGGKILLTQNLERKTCFEISFPKSL